jgi:hypothetical protein
VEGVRQADGSILAAKIEAKPNGTQSFETDVLQSTNAAEQQYKREGRIAEQGPDGKEQVLGALKTQGPEVDRARKIIDRLLPGYVKPESVRVYVVENKEWNAMAMANFSIYVFGGIMKDLDDDEMAIVLGHELTHATHEHSRRQVQKSMYAGIAGQIAQIGLTQVQSGVARDVASTAAGRAFPRSATYSRSTKIRRTAWGFATSRGGIRLSQSLALWRRLLQVRDGNPSRTSSSATTVQLRPPQIGGEIEQLFRPGEGPSRTHAMRCFLPAR